MGGVVNTSEGGESKGGIAYSGGNPSVDSDVPDQLSGATEPLSVFIMYDTPNR